MNALAQLPMFDPPVDAGSSAVLNFATPILVDPALPHRLTRVHAEVALELQGLEGIAGNEVPALARHLIDKIRATHRLEALRIFPVISSRWTRDAAVSAAFGQLRQEAASFSRKLLRLLEEAERNRSIDESDALLAQSLWDRCSHECRELYALYSASGATADRRAAG